MSRALGERLFPGQNPLGKRVYDSLDQAATIVGVVDPIIGNLPSNDHPDWVYFLPRYPFAFGGPLNYVVRTQPGQRAALMRVVEAHMAKSNPDRVIDYVRPLNYFRDLTYLSDRAMEIYLITVTTLLIAVTCLGIFALATFNVSTRTKQIGTRRAVGARRRDIVRYFLVENGLITSAGVVVGCAPGPRCRLLAVDRLRPAAPRPLLPGGRGAAAVGHRPARRLAAGATRRRGVAVGRHAHGVSATAR